jgi:16S rRNA (guanine527-N7)-methyltransferase
LTGQNPYRRQEIVSFLGSRGHESDEGALAGRVDCCAAGVSPYTRRMLEAFAADIAALAARWSCPVASAQVAKLCGFFDRLLEWNAQINLTGAKDMAELVRDHLPDSFALSRLVPLSATVVDVGSGGGLPAVPFAVLRDDCKVTLVEPRAKRAAFLRMAARSLGAPDLCVVIRGRDSDLLAGRYDVAASRATFSPGDWARAAQRLVVAGGRVVVFASAAPEEGLVGLPLKEAVSYTTRRGAPRWAGAYVPRGTDPD